MVPDLFSLYCRTIGIFLAQKQLSILTEKDDKIRPSFIQKCRVNSRRSMASAGDRKAHMGPVIYVVKSSILGILFTSLVQGTKLRRIDSLVHLF